MRYVQTDNINIKIGIFTDLSHDHLDYHKNMKSYLNSKMYLFESLLNKIRVEGIRFLSRVEIEIEDSGELNLPKQNQKQTLDHQSPQSALETPKPESKQEQSSGNRRLRRAEAKLARKNAKKK